MAPTNRSAFRNPFIYDSKNSGGAVSGGLSVVKGITNANLYLIVEIFCSIKGTYCLHNESEKVVQRDAQRLQPGKYFLVTNSRFLHCFHDQHLLTADGFYHCYRRSLASSCRGVFRNRNSGWIILWCGEKKRQEMHYNRWSSEGGPCWQVAELRLLSSFSFGVQGKMERNWVR